jgi:type II secretory pathway component GspD/PulD (secretin)
MRLKTVAFATILFAFASIATAQTAPAAAPRLDKTFDFTNKPSQQGLQELATILRTVGDIQQLSIDAAASTVTVHGTADELAMSAWILHSLDRPAGAQPASDVTPPQYLIPGKSDDLIRIYHLAHAETPQNVQEMLTVLRTVADTQKIFNYSPLTDLVIRGPANQMALVDYFISGLDVAPGSVTTSPEFHYTYSVNDRSGPTRLTDVARVIYLTHTTTPQGVQEILTTLRTVVDFQKVFNYTPLSALAVRGWASNVEAAEWIVRSLDLPADAEAKQPERTREFTLPANFEEGNVIGVYYPANIAGRDLAPTLTMLREKLQIRKAFLKSVPAALVFRGTADQVTKAEQLIKDKDQPAASAMAVTPPAR